VLPVEPPHTGSGPAIVQLGIGFTVTVLLQVLVHPFLLILSVTVYDPEACAVTLIDAPFVAPTIVPSPVIDQL
jgi:hypothetical protein